MVKLFHGNLNEYQKKVLKLNLQQNLKEFTDKIVHILSMKM